MSYKANYALIDWSKPMTVERPQRAAPARSFLPCPHIIGDVMEPVQSMASGKYYESKSAIRAEYKRLGMVEIGNDPARIRPRDRTKKKVDRKAIKTTLEIAEARFKRGERVNRHKIAQA